MSAYAKWRESQKVTNELLEFILSEKGKSSSDNLARKLKLQRLGVTAGFIRNIWFGPKVRRVK